MSAHPTLGKARIRIQFDKIIMSLPLPCLLLTENHRKPGLFLDNADKVDNVDNLKAKVLRFQSILTLTLSKIYREAGAGPATHAPQCGAETAARAPRPAITSLSRPIQSPPTRLREGQQFYGLLGNYLLSTGARHQTSLLCCLQTSADCELMQLFRRTHLFSKLAKSPRNGQASPMGKHANPMHNPVFTYSPATPV
jgi:hypothetical protein